MSTAALMFSLLFVAGCGLALVRHPIYGLYSYLLAFYMAPETKWWAAQLPSLRWSLVAGVVSLVAVLIHRPGRLRAPWHQHPAARALIFFVVWLWIQTPWALSITDHLFLAVLFTKYLLMFAILYSTLSDAKDIQNFALVHVIGCAVWGIEAYMDPGSGRLENIGSGDVAGSAFASMQMSTALAFAGFLFLGIPNPKRWIVFAAIPFILNAVILMATRGAFVGIVAAAPFAILFAPKAKRKMTIAYAALGGALLLVLAHDYFWQRMSTIPTTQGTVMEQSAASRIDVAKANFEMFQDHPLGVGHRGNDLLSPQYLSEALLTSTEGGRIRSAHNVLMAVLVDHGIIGFSLFIFFHLRIVGALRRLRRGAADKLPQDLQALCAAIIASLAIYWANAQFANMFKAEVVIWMASLVAAMEALVNKAPETAASASDWSARRLRHVARLAGSEDVRQATVDRS
jgi:O-antigen ligase/polysaccharide polymerase Wzy-like membrane protein